VDKYTEERDQESSNKKYENINDLHCYHLSNKLKILLAITLNLSSEDLS